MANAVAKEQAKVRKTAPLLPAQAKVKTAPKKSIPVPKPIKPLTWRKKIAKTQPFKQLKKIAKQPKFRKYYLCTSLAVLFVTTLLWSALGALTQQYNADQLANAYLFEDKATFDGAKLPSQHSFLFKWPLWLLIKLGGYSPTVFMLATVFVALLTVALLTYLLYRIERRPLVFGTLLLALSSVLLMIPAQPYAGALLPVNMAMVTTRNLEYIVYIVVLVLLFKPGKLREFGTLLSLALLGLLIASDHLFLSLSLGTGVLVLLLGLARKQRTLWLNGARHIGLTVIAIAVSDGLTRVLSGIGLLQVNGASGATPYALTNTPKDLILGVWYGIMALFTNAGANPAFNGIEIRKIPEAIANNMVGLGAVGYIVNITLVFAGFVAMYWIIRHPAVKPKKQASVAAHDLSVALIASVATSFVLFVGSKHYYAVDARYLGIVPFALFIVLAFRARTIKWQTPYLLVIGFVCIISCIFGSVQSVVAYGDAKKAQSPFTARDQKVLLALKNHRVDVLVGDYWRMLPIKQQSKQQVPVLPLDNCASPRQVLTSSTWQVDLATHKFAYLLSFDKGLTDFPACSLEQITTAYGRPNSSTLIAGTISNPKEVLLFYDSGSHPSAQPDDNVNVLPVDITNLDNLTCQNSTVMQVVAHQDDDLLFMNPDLLHSLQQGHCVRTIYVTAGDSGSKQPYWLAREQGSEAAYANMLGIKNEWVQRVARLGTDRYVTIASPRNNPNISLIFMRLPDGNLDGRGFYNTKNQSLAELQSGEDRRIQAVDGQSSYSAASLVDSISQIMSAYKPDEVRTQSNITGTTFTDHSDHRATGAFTRQAFTTYAANSTGAILAYYMGYPIRESDPNIDPQDLAQKEAAFFAYATHDGGVCSTAEQCTNTPTYGSYLLRQYRTEE